VFYFDKKVVKIDQKDEKRDQEECSNDQLMIEDEKEESSVNELTFSIFLENIGNEETLNNIIRKGASKLENMAFKKLIMDEIPSSSTSKKGEEDKEDVEVEEEDHCKEKKLKNYKFMIERIPCPSSSKIWLELDGNDQLGDSLCGKTIVEFPTIHVIPRSLFEQFPCLIQEQEEEEEEDQDLIENPDHDQRNCLFKNEPEDTFRPNHSHHQQQQNQTHFIDNSQMNSQISAPNYQMNNNHNYQHFQHQNFHPSPYPPQNENISLSYPSYNYVPTSSNIYHSNQIQLENGQSQNSYSQEQNQPSPSSSSSNSPLPYFDYSSS